jgi:hypothetical protein
MVVVGEQTIAQLVTGRYWGITFAALGISYKFGTIPRGFPVALARDERITSVTITYTLPVAISGFAAVMHRF